MSDAFQAPRWQPNILRLWPTIVVRRTLDECEAPNAALVRLIEDMERETDQLTASRWRDGKMFDADHDAIRWLNAGIDETIQGYFDEVGMNYGIGWTIAAWPNINRLGDYHAPHNHAWSYLSGTYYVRVPGADGEGSPDGAAGSGGISFYDPRTSVNMLAANGEALARSEFAVAPHAGTLLIWDASITHSVHPNLAEESRISISFNIALAWSDSYLHEP